MDGAREALLSLADLPESGSAIWRLSTAAKPGLTPCLPFRQSRLTFQTEQGECIMTATQERATRDFGNHFMRGIPVGILALWMGAAAGVQGVSQVAPAAPTGAGSAP